MYTRTVPEEPTTGRDGRFSLTVLGTEQFFVVRVPGYVPAKVFFGTADSTGDVGNVFLRKAKTDNDYFAVQTEDLRVYPRLAQFYDRRNSLKQGAFLIPDEVTLRRSAMLTDVIRRTGGLQRLCLVIGGQIDCARVGDRGPTSINDQPAPEAVCLVAVWFYGMVGPNPAMDAVRMDEVLAFEGYSSPGVTPKEFKDAQCGAIVLWMKGDR